MKKFLLLTFFVLFLLPVLYAVQPQFVVYSGDKKTDAVSLKRTDIYVWSKSCVVMAKKIEKKAYLNCTYYMVQNWFGFGYPVLPENSSVNMSGYASGSISFWVRSEADLDKYVNVGIKSGSCEAWIGNIAKYGFVKNGRWCRVSIPVVDFVLSGGGSFNLKNINEYFMIKGAGREMPFKMTFDVGEISWNVKNS
jgi:hypothetical protein